MIRKKIFKVLHLIQKRLRKFLKTRIYNSYLIIYLLFSNSFFYQNYLIKDIGGAVLNYIKLTSSPSLIQLVC